MSTQTFLLPDVGEGLTEAEIVQWRVRPGDDVAVNDVLVEIETAKSLVELPSPFAGTVGEVLAAEGETVNVGAPIITIASTTVPTPGASGLVSPAAGPTTIGQSEHGGPSDPAADSGDGAVLVGYGTGGHEQSRRRKPAAPAAERVAASVGVVAKPPIRKLARDLGVQLSTVVPSGPAGEVTRDDVMKHASQASVFRNIETPAWGEVREETIPVPPAGSARPATVAPATPAPDAAGREETIAVKGVRKATSSAMVQSAYSAPHVSVWTDVDATRTMELVKRLKASPDFADIKVSPLLIMARAVIWAARRTPMVNAAWVDAEGGAEIRVRRYVNLGIAAATPRGLVVPNIKGAQALGLLELAQAINALVATAREGRTSPADMAQGSFTITNVGTVGVDAGTPILNPGESGILCFGQIARRPWVVGTGADERIEARWVTTLAVSFDHRLADGAQGSTFLADVAGILGDPGLGLLF